MSQKKYNVGYIGKTKSGLKYIVIKHQKDCITIQFLETGYILDVNSAKLSNGYIKDKLKPSVCGVGYLGYCESPHRSKEYNLWHGIIQRCYNTKRKDYQKYGCKRSNGF